jgi:hypothetical protein
VAGGSADVELLISGEAPIRYVERPPDVVVRAGSAVLLRAIRPRDFAWCEPVPMAALAATGSVITIATSEMKRPWWPAALAAASSGSPK